MKTANLTKETVRVYSKALRTPTFNQYEEIIKRLGNDDGYGEFLVKLMEAEIETRTEKAKNRKIKKACFPFLKTFDELDLSRFEHVSAAELRELASCDFVEQKTNLVMIGNPGTGKSHLAIALGIKACQRGYNVRFITASDLVCQMSEASEERRLMRFVKQINKVDLLIIDELSYLRMNKAQSDFMFKVISDRSERKSTIITTNLSFSDWPSIFGDDPMLVTALAGRLTFKSQVLNINSEHPYRNGDNNENNR